MTVNISRVTTPDALFCQYPGQFKPQEVALELDTRTGVLSCSYNPIMGGGTTFDHYNGFILEATIPCLTADAANQLMEDVAPLAETVYAGASEHWDGNNNVGTLTPEAKQAWEQIRQTCAAWLQSDEPSLLVSNYTVADWFTEGDAGTTAMVGITTDTTDDELDAMATDQVDEATTAGDAGYSILDHDDVLEYLTYLRTTLRRQFVEQLAEVAEQQREFKASRDQGIGEVVAWKDPSYSSRALGELVGLSHRRVQAIGRTYNPARTDTP